MEHAFPPDADERIQALNGVRNAGIYWTMDAEVSGVPLPGRDSALHTVLAASPGFLRAIGPTLGQGRIYDEYHEQTAHQVAVLGRALADQLGITEVRYQPVIFVNGTPFMVIGIVDDVRRNAETLLDVIVPTRTAAGLWGTSKAQMKMLIETELGAVQVVGSQAALALRPDDPTRFTVLTPPDPRSLRDAVNPT